jgi:(2Fe-2S) ferredoxin
MPPYERHVFICTNERPAGHPRGCCKARGSDSVRTALKGEIHRLGLASIVRVNTSGCLDACESGPMMVIYPEGIWYGHVEASDAEEIAEKTIMNGQVIERLLIPEPRYAPTRLQYPILVKPAAEGGAQ